MSELVMHPQTAVALERFVRQPSHAVLITGEPGMGKRSVALRLIADILLVEDEKLARYPYLRIISSEPDKAISIDAVRELEHFLALSVPDKKRLLNRVAFIEDAHKLTIEAQNALLKTLEEPPERSLLVLAASRPEALLPTIRSRLQVLRVLRPEPDALHAHFAAHGYKGMEVQKVQAISGGLPGLTAALLDSEQDHPLFAAVQVARELLQSNAFERLLRVDELSKQRALCSGVLLVLMQMARSALVGGNSATAKRWQTVLTQAYAAEEALASSAQPKLALTHLMLSL